MTLKTSVMYERLSTHQKRRPEVLPKTTQNGKKNMKKSNNVLRWKGWVVNVIIFYVRSHGKYF